MKIIPLDIETLPIEGYCWGIWEQNLGLEQIKQDWTLASVAWKELGAKKVNYISVAGQKNLRDDKAIARTIWEVLDSADVVVAQNGKKFDLKKINSRLIQHGFKPYSPVRVVDTLQVARSVFGFTSTKLKWVSQLLTDAPKDDHKEFPGFELWLECLKGNTRAWKAMKEYNIQDVETLEKYYYKLRPWITSHPNPATYSDGVAPQCTKCGSSRVQARGYAVLQQGRYQRYHCQDCGGWSRGKIMLLTPEKRRSMLA